MRRSRFGTGMILQLVLRFAAARPTTTLTRLSILRASGPRPCATAFLRRASVRGRAAAGVGAEVKMHFAWRAAKSWPLSEAPAWNSSGTRRGNGLQR